MRYAMSVFTLVLLVSVSLGSQAGFQNPSETKPLYQPNGNEAILTGTINVKGEVPEAKTIDMYADPICVQLNPIAKTEWIITNNGRLLNVFIYVKDGEPLKTYRFVVPDTEAVLERKNCSFSPRVLGIRVGQRLAIPNDDPTTHNTHPTPKVNQEWNYSQAPYAPALIKTFSRPEMFIPFKCNQHPWEKAYVSVLDHPFFAVSDGLGNYQIRGLPPGTYKLVAWHERLGEQEMEISVVAGESRKIDFAFDAVKATASR